MRDDNVTLGQHLDQVTLAQPIGKIPTYAQLNDFGLEPAAAIDRTPRDDDRIELLIARLKYGFRTDFSHQTNSTGVTQTEDLKLPRKLPRKCLDPLVLDR